MAIDTYRHPEEVWEVEAGPPGLERVPMSCINVLPQVRRSYAPDYIYELARSMKVGDKQEINLINALSIARFDTELAVKQFLLDHGQHFNHEQVLEDMQLYNGRYHILNSGHCRRLAIMQLCQEWGFNLDRMGVAVVNYDNMTFEEALANQVRENVHLRPDPRDDAHNILQYYELRKLRQGRPPTNKECAEVLGYSASKIGDALRYARLPLEIQEFTQGERPLLAYSTVVMMAPLFVAYFNHYNNEFGDKEKARAQATASIISFAKSRVAEVLRTGSNKHDDVIRAKLDELTHGAPYVMDSLFDVEATAYLTAERRKSDPHGINMGRLAVAALDYRFGHGELSSWEEGRILELANEIQRHRGIGTPQSELFNLP